MRIQPQCQQVASPAFIHQHYKTAFIRQDIGFPHISGMLPGECVAVKYLRHAYAGRHLTPLYMIAKTNDFDRHVKEGTFATVYQAALERFVL
jgi:hypothetical protein